MHVFRVRYWLQFDVLHCYYGRLANPNKATRPGTNGPKLYRLGRFNSPSISEIGLNVSLLISLGVEVERGGEQLDVKRAKYDTRWRCRVVFSFRHAERCRVGPKQRLKPPKLKMYLSWKSVFTLEQPLNENSSRRCKAAFSRSTSGNLDLYNARKILRCWKLKLQKNVRDYRSKTLAVHLKFWTYFSSTNRSWIWAFVALV